jgi:adenylate cyclase
MSSFLVKLLKFSPFKAGCAVAIAAALLYLLVARSSPHLAQALQSVDNRATDVMFRVRGPQPTQDQVAIIDIDEKSLASKELGQWPWPRDKFAKLLRNIHAAKPKAIGLDMVFAEPDRTSLKNYLPRIGKRIGRTITPDPARDDNDEILGEAVGDTEAVVGYLLQMHDDGIPPGDDCPFFPEIEVTENKKPNLKKGYRPILNVMAIEDNAAAAGFFNAEPDDSAMVRRVPLLAEWNDAVFSSLALTVLITGLGVEKVEVPYSEERGAFVVKLGSKEVYVDSEAQIFVNYRGPSGPQGGTFPYYSAVDVYRGKLPPEKLRGRYVLVGTSAAGLMDLRATPFTVGGPGVEIHANIIDNFLVGDALWRDTHLELIVTLLLVAVGGIALSAVLAYAGPIWGGLAGICFMLLATVGNYYAFFLNNQVIGMTWPLVTVLAVCLAVTLANFFTEGKQKRFVRGAFSRYVATEIVDQLMKDPGKLSLDGEEREMTVMFADIRNFTGISEKMAPNDICHLLNDFLTEMTDEIKACLGTVDKFLGDEIMAFWGAPTHDATHAEHSVRAALGMRAQVRVLAKAWSQRGLPLFDMGVGLNSGKVRVGNMGSRDQFNYTVIGDNVNLASRLQGLNKAYGTGIIISQATLDMLPDEFLVRPVDLVRVVGREQPVAIHEPLAIDRSDENMAVAAESFARALQLYRQRKFAEAREIIAALDAEKSEKLYTVYLERLEELSKSPPAEDWDGVFVFTTK